MTSQSQSSLRRASPADARAIADVQVHTWRQVYAGIVPAEFLQQLDVGRREPYWADAIGNLAEADRPWVAESDGFLVGFVAFGSAHDGDDDRRTGEIYSVYVHPDSWLRGIGADLVARRRGFAVPRLHQRNALGCSLPTVAPAHSMSISGGRPTVIPARKRSAASISWRCATCYRCTTSKLDSRKASRRGHVEACSGVDCLIAQFVNS